MEQIVGYMFSESVTESEPTNIKETSLGSVIIDTTLQDGDVPNRNDRVYPTSVIKNGIQGDYVQERLKTKSWFGEAGHPLSQSVQRQLRIEHDNISHRINKVWFEDNLLKGEVETTLTARGNDMKGLAKQGARLAFSLRGFGKVTEKKNNLLYIRDPLNILCYDWVIHPSHKTAYMNESFTGFDDVSVLKEDAYFVPISSSEVNKFLNESSQTIKSFKNQLDFANPKVIGKNKQNDLIYLQEGHRIFACYLEKDLSKEITNYLSRL